MNTCTPPQRQEPLSKRVRDLADRLRLKAETINRKYRDQSPMTTAHIVAAFETAAEELEDLLR